MKKLVALLLLLALLVPMFAACGGSDDNKSETPPTETLEENSDAVLKVAEKTSLGLEQVLKLNVTYVPAKDGDELTFTSSDKTIVKCNSKNGTLTGLKEGTATVTISTPDNAMTVTTEVTVKDPLKGASAAFFGDSICMASTHDKVHQWWGWAGRINAAYGLSKYVNKGVDGASLSTVRGTNRVINYLNNIKGQNYEFIVLHGGTNDGMDSTPVGVMSDSFDVNDFDTTTFAGGLEELFYTARKNHPNSKICYIINFRIEATNWGPLMTVEGMTPYYTLAKEICKKWNIPYLDLFFDKDFCAAFDHTNKNLIPDGVHPNSLAYDILTPYIAQFMRQVSYGIDVANQK